MSLKLKFLQLGYLISAVCLFLYSFTQVDLSLTLSRWSIWQVIQKYFQQIGYFQRPLSSLLFVGIILALFIFYLLLFNSAYREKISKKTIWFLVIATTIILTFSYNAFSYDLFNYIFDAKIVTFYHQSPYLHKALDYASDPMLSFMHWTHRLYPYGPTWLVLTVPLSFIGMQFFLPTFFLFKILISVSFLGTVFFIGKILRKISPKNELLGITFFALNPLVITESLVSAHNDIMMMFLVMWAIYLFLDKKSFRSFILLILSIGVKFVTLLIAPVLIAVYFLRKYQKSINWEKIILLIIGLMIGSVIMATLRTTFQPWYLLYVLPFASLMPNKYYIIIPTVIISLFACFQYLPFLYLGNWNDPVPTMLNNMMLVSIMMALIASSIQFFKIRTIK